MQNQTNSTTAELFWTTYESPSFNSTKRVGFTIVANDTRQRYYVIDLSATASWTGALKQLRFDPTIAGAGTVKVDFIKITGAYLSILAKIPGTIEAENFNRGGQGNAYNDATPTSNSGNQYRTTEGVDISIHPQQATNYVLGWTVAGEWLEYVIEVEKETYYSIQAHVSAPTATARIAVELNGELISPEIQIPNTGAYTTYKAIEVITNKKIAIGTHVLRIHVNSAGFNIDKIVFSDAVKTQTISLQKGWNLISTNVDVQDSAIEKIFAGLDVQMVKNTNGFWKKGQISAFNSLKTITPGNGYLVYMNTAGTITISGIPCTGELLFAPTGWQLIGYPCTGESLFAPTPISNYFNTSNCQTIKNFDGFWVPNGTSNSLQNLEPGKGYWLKK
ncbi:MAG: Carbohydrate binding module (family 6) [Bacteroidetes bacterium ADurb.Bin217]|nr:MAG: Carbohydrate binding module (family 6) [Bacteroidetes bacterium ADurb.Bin217]